MLNETMLRNSQIIYCLPQNSGHFKSRFLLWCELPDITYNIGLFSIFFCDWKNSFNYQTLWQLQTQSEKERICVHNFPRYFQFTQGN